MSDELLQRLKAFMAPEYTKVRRGLDPVNAAMIRHWCEAMGDANPAYAGDDAIAPPHMIGAWVMRPMDPGEPDMMDGRRRVGEVLEEAGYTGVVATGTEQEYLRDVRPGDEITAHISVESITGPKQTALGEGYFYVTKTDYKNQNDHVVAVERFHLLKFTPKQRAAGSRPHPSMNADTAFLWEGLKNGELLIQRCSSCKTLRHPPQAMCASCRSLEWDSVVSAGLGGVYSFTVHHHPPMPGFEMPYVVGLIALDEGVRLLANVVDVDPAEVSIGMRVRARIERVDDDLFLPMFAPEP